jgi:hypothetical protein
VHMPDESKFALLTDAETQVLRALANAPHPKEGLPIDWGIGVPLVQKGWAEQASRYGVNQRGSTTRDQRPITTHNNG